MSALTALAAAAAIVPLALILGHVVYRGAGAITPEFFTRPPAPAGAGGGGVANAIAGTLVLLAIAAAVSVPVGVGAGVYLAERRGTRRAAVVRYLADVLLGVPSIVVGIVAWQLIVRPTGHFSAWAGGAALGAIVVPLVARTTEEVLLLVPPALSEAALALGYSRWRTSMGVVLRTALPGVVTGALVALARVSGETAALLFTAFGNQHWSLSPDEPIAALPLQVYTYALGPYDEWREQAYGGALVLIALVAGISAAARWATRPRVR